MPTIVVIAGLVGVYHANSRSQLYGEDASSGQRISAFESGHISGKEIHLPARRQGELPAGLLRVGFCGGKGAGHDGHKERSNATANRQVHLQARTFSKNH
jgi:hypothetical protein